MHDAVLELDVALEVEGLRVILEVLLDLRVVREIRVLLGHWEVLEGQLMLEVSICSERYALEWPLGFPNAQLPPIRSDDSKTVCSTS